MDYIEKIVWHEVTTRPPTEEENEEYKRIWEMTYVLCLTSPCRKMGRESSLKPNME